MRLSVGLVGLLIGCSATVRKSGGDEEPEGSGQDTSTAAQETGSAETGSPGDTSGACPLPPWKTSVPGEVASMGAGEGVSSGELESAEALAAAVLEDPFAAAVFWREAGTERYIVHTQSGLFHFVRSRGDDGNLAFAWEGEAPFLDDPLADADLASELAYPNTQGTSYPSNGYSDDDVRLSFPEMGSANYPNMMRRIAQIFDSGTGPDLGVVLAPWANGGIGSHGGMDLVQSRVPLVMRGPGVKPGTHALGVGLVDIAPTVAGLLGVEPVLGVDGHLGRMVDGQMLKWQDGRVIDEILVEACAYGAAPRAVVIILDGMSHTELIDGVAEGRLPHLGRLVDAQAAVVAGGGISGWPTYSLPGHATVHTGALQGHHGLLSNNFVDRATGASAPGVGLEDALADPEAGAAALNSYLSESVETLYEAVNRTYPDAVTANINELTFRGATWSRSGPSGPPPPGLTDYFEYSFADQTAVLQVEQMLEAVGPPAYLALSMYLPDGVGQGEGPHGDVLREAMVETDTRIGQILDLYQEAGAFEDTLWVLTADHGMALQDNARTSEWSSRVSATGISTSNNGRMLVIR